MKRFKNLFNKFYDKSFCRAAIMNAAQHKTRRKSVVKVVRNIDEYTNKLQSILISQSYVPSPTQPLYVTDQSSGKIREIYPPRFFPDQCVHWAVVMAIKPALMRGMYDHSVGNIPGRGQSAGVKYVKKVLKDHKKRTKYCLYFDIHHFYQSIDQEKLISMLKNVINDKRMISLISVIIRAYDDGLPLGNYTSQWLANFYLQGFDHYMKEKLKAPFYCRYVDDCIVIGPNKRKLHRIQESALSYLKSIGLTMKPNFQVFPIDKRGIDFLGYRFYHDRTIMRRRNFKRFRRQALRIHKKITEQKPISAHTAAGFLSRCGQLKWCNSFTIKLKYISGTDNRIIKGIVRRYYGF